MVEFYALAFALELVLDGEHGSARPLGGEYRVFGPHSPRKVDEAPRAGRDHFAVPDGAGPPAETRPVREVRCHLYRRPARPRICSHGPIDAASSTLVEHGPAQAVKEPPERVHLRQGWLDLATAGDGYVCLGRGIRLRGRAFSVQASQDLGGAFCCAHAGEHTASPLPMPVAADIALRARAELALRQRSIERVGAPAESFRAFIARVLPSFAWDPHVELMVETGQRVVDGEITRLLVSAPPRYRKSLVWARLLPAYYLSIRGQEWVSVVSCSAALAEIMSGDAREFYRVSGAASRMDSQDKSLWRTIRGGGMWARGIGGWALGVGYNLGIVDDPFAKWEDAMRPGQQETVEEYFWKTYMGRREVSGDRPAAIVVNHQALAEGDLRGRILKREKEEKLPSEGWFVLNLPAIKRPRRDPWPRSVKVIPDVARWDGPEEPARPRRDNEVLCGALQDQDLEGLLRLEASDKYLFAATHQQEPLPDIGGTLFMRWWWEPMGDADLIAEMRGLGFTLNEILEELERRGQISQRLREGRAWDFAATEGAGDFTASTRGAIFRDRRLLYTDAFDRQIDAAFVKDLIIETAHKDGKGVEVILPEEPAAAGKILISDLKTSLGAQGFRVLVVPTKGSKWVRAIPHASAAKADKDGNMGRCFILPGDWTTRWTEQHHRFDGVTKPMDLVDSASELFSELNLSGFLTSAVR